MNPTLIGSALFAAILFSNIDPSHSECCYVPLKCTEGSKSVDRCYDCTEATLYCGVGKCNVLGCNCDNGCRQGDSTLWCWNLSSNCKGKYFYSKFLSIVQTDNRLEPSVSQLLSNFDTNGDQQLSFDETKEYLTRFGPQNINIELEFNLLDKNGDKQLSIKEIDG